MAQGRAALEAYLQEADALPLRDYVPLVEGTLVDRFGRACCRGQLVRAEPDDDINYTVLALLLLEEKGAAFDTVDVARACFPSGGEAGFDLAECSDNEYNDWIGAQIRADLYGWVCPGRPALAAELARRDASLSHRGEGVYGAMFVAAFGAAIPATESLDAALEAALEQIPHESDATAAVRLGRELSGHADAVARLHQRYADLSPVHALNNLALAVWALCSADGDFGAAIGEAVAAGWDTDCNGATVGGLFGLTGAPIPEAWTRPWAGRVGLGLAGHAELDLDELVERTVAVSRMLS
jgi:ADP-ribosylglycohydrolase